ncbi:MAG: alpha/beta fold hydrolase [Xanthomonadales bacterium]|nr:alpha/beta fold hydrolase [Xanthomonadales bacterium]
MPEHVILLHGLWMRGFALWPLAQRLRAAGFDVATFDYASVVLGAASAVQRLRRRLVGGAVNGSPIHLVGHSLGGLVALQAVRGGAGVPAGRIVCLGSPLRGSASARDLALLPGGRGLLGRSADLLGAGIPDWDGSREVGVIAGTLPLGFGRALGRLSPPHDGTVAVAETRLPGVSDHRLVHASHTGLLLSREVAELTAAFLRHGRFS